MRVYEASINRMTKGVTRTVKTKAGDHTATFQRSYEPAEGIGDAASWSEKSGQLAVRSGDKVLYLDVRVEEDAVANLALAKKLAQKATE